MILSQENVDLGKDVKIVSNVLERNANERNTKVKLEKKLRASARDHRV